MLDTSTVEARPKTAQRDFDRVAPNYDKLNFLFSLGQERRWRRRALARFALPPQAKVLDAACGTGAMTDILLRSRSDVHCTGIDQNVDMLRVAIVRKLTRARWCLGTVDDLPFDDKEFDGSMLGFALDDLEDPRAGLRELHRVCRPGSQLLTLDFGLPQGGSIRWFIDSYLHWLERYGERVSGARYDHLAREILRAPSAVSRHAMLAQNGWRVESEDSFMGGVVQLTLARRASSSSNRKSGQ